MAVSPRDEAPEASTVGPGLRYHRRMQKRAQRPLVRSVLGLAIAALALIASGLAFAQTARIPAGHGWFCFEELTASGATSMSCDRPQRACERLRTQRRAAGEPAGACVPQPSAWCVTWIDAADGTPTPRHYCARIQAHCEETRSRLGASNAGSPVFSAISACTEAH